MQLTTGYELQFFTSYHTRTTCRWLAVVHAPAAGLLSNISLQITIEFEKAKFMALDKGAQSKVTG